jgi:hypothetical protein
VARMVVLGIGQIGGGRLYDVAKPRPRCYLTTEKGRNERGGEASARATKRGGKTS